MATKKEQLTRMQQKHDIEANWLKATNFIPMAGEIIVYDPDEVYDYARFKCGDGVTYVNDLPFIIDTDETLSLEGRIADAKATGEAIDALEDTINDLHTTGAEIWMVDASGDEIQRINFSEMIAAEGETINVEIVDTLPDSLKVTTDTEVYFYIVKSTGIAYFDVGQGAMTVGFVVSKGVEGFDKGWTDDINSETELGFYCVRAYKDFAEKKDITWENLPDKPFGEITENLGDTVTWDGNIDEGNDVVTNEVSLGAGTIRHIKVSDCVPTIDDIGSSPTLKYIGDDGNEHTASSEMVQISELNEDIISIGYIFPFVMIVQADNSQVEGIVFPEKGVYFMQAFAADGSIVTRCTSFTIPNYNFVNTTLKKIDEKYLPVDNTLTKEGVPADAKAVGDRLDVLEDRPLVIIDSSLSQPNYAADAKVVGDKFNNYATKTYVDSAVANSGGGGGAAIGTYSANLAYTLKDNGEYEVSGIGTCTDTHIVIPSIVNSKKVTSIGDEAFSDCLNIVSVTIPNSVTVIGAKAFLACEKLERVAIPDGVTTIGQQAFSYCSKLASVTIPKSVTTIAKHAFLYSYQNNLTIYCEVESQPSGWDAAWNFDNFPVVWGAALDFASVNGKLASGGGGASGGGDTPIIGSAEVYVYAYGALMGLAQAWTLDDHLPTVVHTQVVKELPSSLAQTDYNDDGEYPIQTYYIYVVEGTGIAYLDDGDGITTLGEYRWSETSANKGWSTDINLETEEGFYCVRTFGKQPTIWRIHGEVGNTPEASFPFTPIEWEEIQKNFENTLIYYYPSEGNLVILRPEMKVTNEGKTVCFYACNGTTDNGRFTGVVSVIDFDGYQDAVLQIVT